MNQLPAVVVKELDVSVLLCSDGDGKSRVAEDLVDLTGSAWLKTDKHVRHHAAGEGIQTKSLATKNLTCGLIMLYGFFFFSLT